MRPRATIRLQFNAAFTFADALAQSDYFSDMGFSHVYASPILQARSDSTHGYDVVDPTRVDAKLGGMAGFRTLAEGLARRNIGIILDIVPNHLAADAHENPWWRDVLRRGRQSDFADYFDIEWEPADPALRSKVVLPILGEPLNHALASGSLRVERGEDAEPELVYRGARYPLRPEDRGVANGMPLVELLSHQNYQLVHWSEAATRLNWRRFFDVNELVSLRVEREEVFELTHSLFFTLYKERLVDGFRVDHVDGLADPAGYCRRLRHRLNQLMAAGNRSAPTYLVVEKILGFGERIPDWPIDGTTGYDFMNEISAWCHQASGAERLKAIWWKMTGDLRSFPDVELEARVEMLNGNLRTDLDRCTRAFIQQHAGGYGFDDVRFALARLLALMPVYRTYITEHEIPSGDRNVLARAMSGVRRGESREVSDVVEFVLQKLIIGGAAMTRFQQLSSVLAAKGGEDTALYRYGPVLSRNDVGASPGLFSISTESLHAAAARRQASHPHAMLATATHDMKRGEDSRMRLAVLTEVPQEWAAAVDRWIERGPEAPRPADQLMLFQTVIGAWPMATEQADLGALAGRLSEWQRKALREAKLNSSWAFPNESYEARCESFLRRFLEQRGAEIACFVERISVAGIVNSLSQLVLKLTMPGIPDTYQGCDRWDLSLVDPDNRRPVDFAVRAEMAQLADIPALLPSWRTGGVKQAMTHRLLTLRAENTALFHEGGYEPVSVEGALAHHAIAFARRTRDRDVVVVATRFCSPWTHAHSLPLIPPAAWQDTRALLPRRGIFQDVLTHWSVSPGPDLPLADVLSALPVSVLLSQ